MVSTSKIYIAGVAQYTYIFCKNKNIFALAVKQARKTYQSLAFLPVSKAHTNRFYVFRHFTCISICLDKDSINTKNKTKQE